MSHSLDLLSLAIVSPVDTRGQQLSPQRSLHVRRQWPTVIHSLQLLQPDNAYQAGAFAFETELTSIAGQLPRSAGFSTPKTVL